MTTAAEPPTTVLRLRRDRPHRLEALLVGAGPHLEPVLDVGSATNGDLLVVLPAPAVHLTALLEAPDGLRAGEAVTVLVPLAQALERLHDVGVAHGGVRAGAVVLDADGSPSWTAPVAPTLARAVGEARFAERAAEDVAGFRALAAALLGASGERLPEGEGLGALADALFRIARPEPVRLARPVVPPVAALPARLLPAAAESAAEPAAAGRLLADLGSRLRAARPRVWTALATAVVLLAGALTLLPSGDAVPVAAPSPATASASAPASRAPSPTPVAGPAVGAAAAVSALLAERDRCLERGSESCLRRVDAVDSPVLDADLRAVRAGVDAVRIDPEGLRVSSTGGTALAVGGASTVLAIRDRNDWRLRDVVAEPPVGR